MQPAMRRFVVAALAWTLAGVALAAPKDDESKASEINLDGVWRGFVVEGKGEQPDRGPTHLELTIKGDHISAQKLDGEAGPLGEGSYKIKSGRLTFLDATEIRTEGKRRTYLGICKATPDELRWCVATPGSRRPAVFQSRGQQFLLILKRQ